MNEKLRAVFGLCLRAHLTAAVRQIVPKPWMNRWLRTS